MVRALLMICTVLCLSAVSEPMAINAQEQPKHYSPTGKKLPTVLPTVLQSKKKYGRAPDQLESFSESAFRRSLMPLKDHLQYLAMARDARLSGSDISKEQELAAWGGYRERLKAVIPAMRSLNQPSASNWASELAWANYAVVRAEQRIAEISENSSAYEAATRQVQDASGQLLAQREFDNTLGLATVSDLTYAQDRFLAANQSSKSRRIELLEHTKSMQQKWNRSGAGVGRTDRVLETQLTQDLMRFQETLQEGDIEKVSAQLSRVQQVSQRHFQVSAEFYSHGTAPLHQLTKSMMLRQRLRQLQQVVPELEDESSDLQFQRDWRQLKQSAATVSDRRGRMSADLLAIDLLGLSVEE